MISVYVFRDEEWLAIGDGHIPQTFNLIHVYDGEEHVDSIKYDGSVHHAPMVAPHELSSRYWTAFT